MKLKQTLTALAVAAAATMAAAPASAAADYSLLFQGVTFEIDILDADSLTLTMLGTDSASGNWTGITNLNAFQLKGIGSFATATTRQRSSVASRRRRYVPRSRTTKCGSR